MTLDNYIKIRDSYNNEIVTVKELIKHSVKKLNEINDRTRTDSDMINNKEKILELYKTICELNETLREKYKLLEQVTAKYFNTEEIR